MKIVQNLLKVLSLCALVITLGSAKESEMKKAYFSGGCFWGVEYYLEAQNGVQEVISGFMGGHTKDPIYQEVIYGGTGHIETVEVVYDASAVSYEELTKLFFEIHDFTQVGGQGPDRGERYESYVFYSSQEEKAIVKNLIKILSDKGYKVATKLQKSTSFYSADSYHQDYYERNNKKPYCHAYKKIF